MPKNQFNAAQTEHLNIYLPDYISKLDACATTHELTRWKQATATKALASPAFANLDLVKHTRAKWFEMIVRKYTNYLHQVYRKAHPEQPSASEIINANPLLKFRSVSSGRQLFARDMHEEVVAASKQHVIDKGTNDAGAYQMVLKRMWDALSADEKSDWDAKAEDECGDVKMNQEDFSTYIHQALRGLCQSGIIGDAEILLFYAFREPDIGDLKAGTIHGHSKHNKTHFGGDELELTYGVPWAKFADTVIPRPVVYDSPYPITVTEDGVVVFPSIELDEIPPATLRHLLEEFFEKCWRHRQESHGSLQGGPLPWDQIVLNPANFYDTEKFSFPFALKEPQTFTTFETLAIAEFLNSPKSAGFHFKNQPGVQPDRAISPPLESPPPAIRDNVNPPPFQELPPPTLPADSPPPI
ncbi:hypothetical protein B0H13DRAFT_2326645 [Mycena leptocephala]|nr:hypothetical protein B0H13DRAFT_2326645 [Mycena leptocephala]